MPEWSNGPHSKCGVRATVPGVRIPLFPQRAKCHENLCKFAEVFFVYASDLGVYSLSRLCRQKNSIRVRGTLLFARALAASDKGWASVARQSLSPRLYPPALANTFAEREGFACGNPRVLYPPPSPRLGGGCVLGLQPRQSGDNAPSGTFVLPDNLLIKEK